ncbi:hypothetical protein, partial [Zemynaea arenosa]|uniref:hypothetical protein n=1 Tax=Zemynaea arenosa TaxID=2561931 RepID=UPI0014311172
AAPDCARVRAGATRLEQSLTRGAIDDGALADLTAALSNGPCAGQLHKLREAIDNFDFDRAAQDLRALADCMNSYNEHSAAQAAAKDPQ